MYQYLGSTEIMLYDLFNMLSFVAMLVFNLAQLNRKKHLLSNLSLFVINYFSKKTTNRLLSSATFWTVIEIILISVVVFAPFPILNETFGNIVGTGLNYFGVTFFLPVIIFVLFFLISVNPLRQMDLITPAFPITLTVTKIACFCHGCCNGIECSFGLFNHYTGLIEFPVQLVELCIALLIFIFLMQWRKKAKEGTLFPIYLIIYSGTRFFSEFLRSEPDIIWKLKTYHILCIIGVVVGVIELFVVLKYGEKIKEMFAPDFIIKILDKLKQTQKKKKSKKKTLYQMYKK
jgi:prolipoprotein diacylglyceryltransferase